jgi:hypothetical protein
MVPIRRTGDAIRYIITSCLLSHFYVEGDGGADWRRGLTSQDPSCQLITSHPDFQLKLRAPINQQKRA